MDVSHLYKGKACLQFGQATDESLLFFLIEVNNHKKCYFQKSGLLLCLWFHHLRIGLHILASQLYYYS